MKTQKVYRYQEYRLKPLLKLLPKDINSVLDIGSGNDFFRCLTKNYIGLDIEDADINQDLNENQKIKLPSKSKDLVILSNIIEHITNPAQLIKESKRISKKYILVGLPNEYPLHERIKILFGRFEQDCGIKPYGHKHKFSIKSIEKFVKKNYGKYLFKTYYFEFPGGRFLSQLIRDTIAKLLPTLFVGEVFYLINIGDKNERYKHVLKDLKELIPNS